MEKVLLLKSRPLVFQNIFFLFLFIFFSQLIYNCNYSQDNNCDQGSLSYSAQDCRLREYGCLDECPTSDSKQCSGNGYQVCGNYDEDVCLEWGAITSCGTGYSCEKGECLESCLDECPTSDSKQCSGNGYQVCGNYDEDVCLEWGAVTSCGTGYSCGKGECLENGAGSKVAIAAGCFDMGDAFNEGDPDELPLHHVCVSAFQIGVHEVTNAQYKICAEAGGCTVPYPRYSGIYYSDPSYGNFPVGWVSWDQVKTYCEWVGGRLPTEAEWEFAARGGLAGKRYPWGDDAPDCTRGASNGAMYEPCYPDHPIAVGSFSPNGYGLYDMAGNVLEWVNDSYESGYYEMSPINDPPGINLGRYKVIRGGSFQSQLEDLRVANRDVAEEISVGATNYGFRCVW
ncbi:MAG: SUMF1/EgtB/PvdO family nonheme iron enzyme [bacterium]|nr:SUMF1/EgtB/PvdO family nonheme iron enzyme [bacterium]